MTRDYLMLLDACALSATHAHLQVDDAMFHIEAAVSEFNPPLEMREEYRANSATVTFTMKNEFDYSVSFIFDYSGRVVRAVRFSREVKNAIKRFEKP